MPSAGITSLRLALQIFMHAPPNTNIGPGPSITEVLPQLAFQLAFQLALQLPIVDSYQILHHQVSSILGTTASNLKLRGGKKKGSTHLQGEKV